MLQLNRTNSANKDFETLIALLDSELNGNYGDQMNFYNTFNKIEDCQTVVMVKANNKPVGCGCFKPFDKHTVEIKRMFVKKDSRGKGISKTILNELETWAKEIGYQYAVLETGVKQTEAQGLYERFGYQITDNYGQYVGVDNSICMKKNISD